MKVACILTDHNFLLFNLSGRNYCISDESIIAEGTKNDLLKIQSNKKMELILLLINVS